MKNKLNRVCTALAALIITTPVATYSNEAVNNLDEHYPWHVVEAGETLASIAQEWFGSAMYLERIMSLNGLMTTTSLQVGQRLLMVDQGEGVFPSVVHTDRAPVEIAIRSANWLD